MNQNRIQDILGQHSLWLMDQSRGEMANLYGANLGKANLNSADLRRANLNGADLSDADLRSADLSRAAIIEAELIGANLSRANLKGADLRGATFIEANLYGADLRGADLAGANLTEANITGAILPDFQIEQEKELIVYKKLFDGIVATLRIPAGVARTATPIGNKCRAAEAVVVELTSKKGVPMADDFIGQSLHDPSFGYRKTRVVNPIHPYNGDIRLECVSGIHFFQTKEEAVAYDF